MGCILIRPIRTRNLSTQMTSLLNTLIAKFARAFYLRRHNKAWEGVPQTKLPVSNLCVELDGRQISLRMYHGKADKPMVIYAHGGGWVVGTWIRTTDFAGR